MTNYSLVSNIHAKTSLFSQVPKGGFHPHLYLYLDSSRTMALTFTYKILCSDTQNPTHAQHLIKQIIPFTSSQTRLKTTF